MKSAYRLVWNVAKKLFSVAPGMVKDKDPIVEDSSHATDHTPPISSFVMALEPRFMYDAAGAVTVEALFDHGTDAHITTNHIATDAALVTDHAVDHTTSLLDALANTIIPAAIAPPVADASVTEVMFVDPRVQDIQTLISGVKPGIEVVCFDTEQDGVSQISNYLQSHQDISTINIFSHGATGSIAIGATTLDALTISQRASEISAWSASLTTDADILIYGCDVGAGSQGSAFIGRLAQTTGADVAASTNLTGAASKGGDWVLEAATGSIEAKSPLTDVAMDGYDALMENPSITTPSAPTINEDGSYSFAGFDVTYGGGETAFEAVVTVTTANAGHIVDGAVSETMLASQGSNAAVVNFLNSLSFQDAQDWHGDASIDITINVYNGSYDAANIVGTSTSSLLVTVNSINDAPSGADNSITISEDGSHTFTASEFGFSDAKDATGPSGTNALSAVKITALPLNGTLKNGSTTLTTGDSVSVADIAANQLIYTPTADANGTGYGNFTFQVQDDGGVANGGIDLDPAAKTMTIDVTPVNDAPTTTDAALSVDKNSILTFSLTSQDVDGGTGVNDAAVTQYKIDTLPTDGVLKNNSGTTLNAGDVITVAEATDMTFAPDANYTGAPSFTFEAIDAAAAHSTPVSTVNITVNSVNMAPVLTVSGAQSVNEDTSLALSGISIADTDDGGGTEQVTISASHGNINFSSTTGLTSVTTNDSHSVTVQGTLADINTALGSSNITYAPDHDYPNSESSATDTITIQVDDLGNTGGANLTDTKTITVTVNPVSDTPITGVAALAAVNEDTLDPAGATVTALLTSFSDADGNTLAGIAVSADNSLSSQGVWYYSVDAGISWHDVGSVSAGSALLLDSSAKLRFVPTANWNGTPGSLTINAIDNSASRTYSSNATSQTTDINSGAIDIDASGTSLGTSITSVADPFVYEVDKYMKVDEGGTTVLDAATLKITNVEADAVHVVYTVTGTSFTDGGMQFDSAHDASWATTVITGTTFTQDDIDNGYLRYVHNGNETDGVDQTLSYTVSEGATSADRNLTIKVSPVNDLPVLYTPGDTAPDSSVLAASIQKGSSITFSTSNIQVTDSDNSSEQLVFRLEALPTHGTLTFNGNAVAIGTVFNYANLSGLRYSHDNTDASSYGNLDTFNVSLRDGAGGVVSSRAVNITIGAVNTSPTGIGNLSTSIFEDSVTNNGVAISSFTGFNFSDPDAASFTKGIAIVGGNTADSATQGTWEYSTTGTNWSDIGTVNDTGNALVLSPGTLVRFVPVLNYNSTPVGTLSVRALDNTYSGSTSISNGTETRVTLDTSVGNRGGSTAVSDNLNDLAITVVSVNDDPTLATITPLALVSGEISKTISTSQLFATDVDSAVITYRLESRPTFGLLLLNGTPLSVGSIFTQADIAANKVTYQNYYNNSTDGFYVTVRDGGYNVELNRPGGIYSGSTIDKIAVPITIAVPVATTGRTGGGGGTGGGVDGYGVGTITIPGDGVVPSANSDELFTGKNSEVLVWNSYFLENDHGVGTLDITAVSTPSNGTVSLSGGVVTFNPTVDFVGDASFQYTMQDSNNATSTATVTVHVLEMNDPLAKNEILVPTEDSSSSFTITNASLKAPDASYIFTLGDILPNNGLLKKDGSTLSYGDTFTQGDIDANRISFTHDGSEHFYSGFTFTLTTGAGVSPITSVFNIDATPINDTPTAGASGAATMGLGETYVFNSGGHIAINILDVDGSGDKTGSSAFQSTDAELGFRVTTLVSHGTLQWHDGSQWVTINASNMASTFISKADLAAGNFEYIQDGTNNFHDSFQLTPDDGKGIVTAGQQSIGTPVTVTLNVVPASLDPVILNDTGLTVANGKAIYESDTVVIHSADLMGTDPDNTDTQIQFRITTDVQYGQLLLNGKVLGVGSAFTQDDLNNNLVSYKHDGLESPHPSGHFTDSFQFALSDGSGGNEPAGTFNIDIIPTNDTPVITVPGARIAVEEQALNITGISIADPDSVSRADVVDNTFGPMLVTLSVGQGTLSFTDTTGLTFVNGTANNGQATVAVTGTLGSLNTALGHLQYQGSANFVGTDTLTIRTDDLGNYGDVNGDKTITIGTADAPGVDNLFDTKTVSITVQPVNNPPVNTVPGAQTLNEDATLTFTAGSNGISVTDYLDTDQGGTDSLSTTISVLHGTLNATTSGGATISSDGTASVTIAGTAAQVNTALDGLVYHPTANFNGADTLTVLTNDLGNTGIGGALTDTDTVAITVSSVNDAPTATAATLTAVNEDAGLAYNPGPNSGDYATPTGSTVAALFSGKYSDITDTVTGGSTATALAGIAITANAETGVSGHWQYDNGGGWTNIAVDGSLSDTSALVLLATDKIRFNPDVANFNGNPGSLTIRQSDGTGFSIGTSVDLGTIDTTHGWSNTVSLGTTVTAINDLPAMTIGVTGFNATENVAADLSSATFSLTDIEATLNEGTGSNQGSVQVTLSNAHGAIHVISSGAASITTNDTGTVVIKGTLADVTGALAGLTYTAADNPGTSEIISVVLSDLGNNGTGTSTVHTVNDSITITVTQANDAPTATGSATLAVVYEDAGASATDPNSGSYTAPTGATVSSLFAGNFSDVDTLALNHTLAGVAITNNAEDGTNGHWEYSTDTGGTWTQILTSGLSDSNALVLTTTDLIRFNPDAANFNGTPNSLTVRLSDGTSFSGGSNKTLSVGPTDGWSNTITLGTSITAVNDAPSISNLDANGITFTEAVGVNVAGTAVLLDAGSDAMLLDVELTGNIETTFNGATLTVQDQSGADTHDFIVIQTGTHISISGGFTTPSGLKLFNNGSSVNYGGTSVATITDNSNGGTLLLTFNANANQTAVNEILHNLAYSNDQDALVSGTKLVDVTFKDGNTTQGNNVQGVGGELSTTATVHIILAPSNDAPFFSAGATITSVEDIVGTTPATPATLASLLGGANFTDPDGVSSLVGVAVSAFSDNSNDATIHGSWEVSFDTGSTWTDLSVLSATAGTISSSNALLLSESTQIKFTADLNANTAGLVTPPRLTVFAVEDSGPTGSSISDGLASSIVFSSAANTLTAYDTTSATLHTAEARVSATSVNIDVEVTENNDVPSLSGTAWTGTLTESPIVGIGTPQQQLLTIANVSDIDLSTTNSLDSNIFGAGTITATIASGATGDKLSLSGSPTGVNTATGGIDGANFVITLNNTTTIAEVNTILEAIRFENTSDSPPSGARSYTITLNDGKNVQVDGDAGGSPLDATTTLTGNITITQANDSPTGVGNMSMTILEDPATNDGTVITALTGYSFSDNDVVDPGASVGGITIVANTANSVTEGIWQYSTTNTFWHDIGSVDDTGTNKALVLAVSSKLRFVPVADFNGVPPALTVRALDNTYGAGVTTWDGNTETRIVLDTSLHGTNSAISNNTNTITITVTAVNDVPSFTKGADQTVLEDAGAQTVTGWATSLSTGPTNESAQTMDFIVSNNNNALFSAQPTIDATGNLTYTSAANANGSATVNVRIHDDGGTSNSGVDTSVLQTFVINVTPVNDAPAGTDNTITILEDGSHTFTAADFGFTDPIDAANSSGANAFITVNINTLPLSGTFTDNGAAVTVGQTIALADITGNQLVFTPAADANGNNYSNFTFQVQDNGGTANSGIDLDQSPNTMTINVTPVNDVPSFTKGADQTVLEDAGAQTVTGWATSLSTGPTNESAQTLDFIVSNNNNTLFSAQPTIDATGNLTYTSAANANGSATVTVRIHDDGGTSNSGVDTSVLQTFVINVTPVNDVPAGTDNTITIVEDGSHTFTAADFGFTDPIDAANSSGANAFVTVKINTLPLSGTFTDNGVAVTVGQTIALADITGNQLVFTPETDINGNNYSDFTFQVQDNGGTANSGIDLDPLPNTMTINVTPVNDAPAGTDNTITILEDGSHTFTSADFGFTDPIDAANNSGTNALLAVKISTLPSNGTLTDNGVAVTVGQAIALADITGNHLMFTPVADANGNNYGDFTFQVQDNGGTANSGIDLDQSPNTMTINVTPVNDAPAGTDNTITILEDGSHTFTAADFGFTDPIDAANSSGTNAFVTVKINTLPLSGTFTDNGSLVTVGQTIALADITGNHLVFTPAADANGNNYGEFTFQVQDNGGTANSGIDLDPSPNTMTINVTPVNDVPSFTKGADQTVLEDAGAQTVNGWATSLSTGPSNESAQTLDFIVSNNNNALFSAQPTIDATGNLTYTSAANANGSATVTVRIHDDGGTSNSGMDTSVLQTFIINVTPVNDVPAGTDNTITILEDGSHTFTAADFGFTDPIDAANNSGTNALDAVKISTLPSNGTLTDNGVAVTVGQTIAFADITGNHLVFTPVADANSNNYGDFTFQVQDNGGTANSGIDLDQSPNTMTINVTPVVDIADNTVITNEDTAVNTSVLVNDSFEGINPTVTFVTQGTHGAVVINTIDNTVTYTPNADYNGADSYTYTVTSGGVTETATVNVNVTGVTDVINDTANTTEDIAITTNVLNNDGFTDTTTIDAVTQGTHGTVSINADKTITYTPNADYNGADSYTYSVTNGGVTETATVNVTVSAVADITNDTLTTTEDTAITANVITGSNGATADTFEGSPILTGVTQGSHGAVTFTADGAVTYTPNTGYSGADSYIYTVTSPTGVTETATVNVNVTGVTDITNDTANTTEDTAITTSVLNNDIFSGTTTINAVTQGTHGTVSINADKTITYTPNADYNGADSYTYSVTNGGVTETATVNVTVSAVADITNDTLTTTEDTAITANVITGTNGATADTFEGSPTLTGVTQGSHGVVTFTADGAVTYTPNVDYNGADSFTYTVTSPSGVTETATVNINITGVTDVINDTANTTEDIAITTNVLNNDGFTDTTTIDAVTQGTHGTVSINADKTITYTPNADYNGADSYTYSVTNGGVTETATVNVTVSAVADITTDTLTTTEDTAITANVITGTNGATADTFEGSPILTGVTQGSHGAVTFTADGGITYTPNVDYNGADSYTYTVTSPSGVIETANVNVTVTPADVYIEPVEPPIVQQVTPPLVTEPPPDTGDGPYTVDNLVVNDFHPISDPHQEHNFWSLLDNNDPPGGSGTQSGLVIIGNDESIIGRDGLYLTKTPSSQEALVNEISSFNLPQGMFRDSNAHAKVKIEATLADGRPLPNWLVFDPESGLFTAKPPVGTGGTLDIKITARDQNGNVAEALFLFHITESKSVRPGAVDANHSNDKTDNSPDMPDRDESTNAPIPHGTDLKDDINLHKHETSQNLKGRSSLAAQLAAFDPRSEMPIFFSTTHQNVTSISKEI